MWPAKMLRWSRHASPALLFLLMGFLGCLSAPEDGVAASSVALEIFRTCSEDQQRHGRCQLQEGTLRITNLTLEASQGTVVGIRIAAPEVNVLVENVTLRGFSIGVEIGSLGCACEITVRSVLLESRESPGPALLFAESSWAAGPLVSVQDTVVRGFATGVSVDRAREVILGNVSVECQQRGLEIDKVPIARLTRVHVADCTSIAIDTILSHSISLADSTIENSGLGLNEGSAGDGGEIEIRYSHFHRNGLAVRTQDAQLSVSKSTFVSNGDGPNNPPSELGSGAVLGALGSGTIRNASFEANRPVAVSSVVGHIDAAYNWWGSPLGPRLLGPAGTPLGAGGDVVAGQVTWAPFLTSPP